MKSTAWKLQTALSQHGRHIRIDSRQFWSEQFGKMCTKYTLRERQGNHDEALLETMKMVNVVQYLAAELKAVQHDEADT